MQIKPLEVTTIIYEKAPNDTSARVILPVSIPTPPNVRAIDCSELSGPEVDQLTTWMREYHEYRDQFMKNMLNFETWVEMTQNVEIKPKWRSFAVDKIK